MNTWFTSDPHFGHQNILSYCNRPFQSLDAMHHALIHNWNTKVKDTDTTYLLGDFSLGKVDAILAYRRQLKGKIVLVRGNHDRSITAMVQAGFEVVVKSLVVELEDLRLYLHHTPMPEELWPERIDWHLCGHVHNNWVRQGKTINVGVDVRGFEPKSLQELLHETSSKE